MKPLGPPSNSASSSHQKRNLVSELEGEARRGMVKVCPRKFDRLLNSRNLSITELAIKANVSRNWLYKLKENKAVKRSSLDEFCKFLEIDANMLLPSPEAIKSEGRAELVPPMGWEVEEFINGWKKSSNGLSYRIVRLRSTHIPGRKARGKCYDLLHVSSSRIPELREHLTRHAVVCHAIGRHPCIGEHIDIRPLDADSGWWVIDHWTDGETLETLIQERLTESSSLSLYDFRDILGDVLEGISAMHHEKIIFRDLSPDKVWICKETKRAMLTDFELAKLIGNLPSVSGTWAPGFFPAPELNDYEAYPASDLFSWARLVVWVSFAGRVKKPELPDDKTIPPAIRKVVEKCLRFRRTERPQSADEVFKIWNQWK